MRVGQSVMIQAGSYKGPYGDDKLAAERERQLSKIRHYEAQQGWIGFPGDSFGGCPSIGKEITGRSCWVSVSVKFRGSFEDVYIEVPTENLILLPIADDLEADFQKKLKALQAKCTHPYVSEDRNRHQVPAFYEKDSPDWEPEYVIYDIYQCQVCRAFLKPNSGKNPKTQWRPGKPEGYARNEENK
jgi:hypothetical protein